MESLTHWESFYVIVGSSGAALTGLQFVVIALVVDVRKRSTEHEINAFATPTIVHFCSVLLVSAILSAPWATAGKPAAALVLLGAGGAAYALVIANRARKQTGYRPVMEDWVFHAVLPFAAYTAVAVAAATLGSHMTGALFVIASMTLVLLFVGIHNAWDTVTFIAVGASQTKP
jgi:hypothetical protein